jgi:hypothetical protein
MLTNDLTTWTNEELDTLPLDGIMFTEFMQRVADRVDDVLWQWSDEPEARVWRYFIRGQAYEPR